MEQSETNRLLNLVLPDGRTVAVKYGTSLLDMMTNKGLADKNILAAMINNHLISLRAPVTKEGHIRWIDLSMAEGTRTFQRSLIFVLSVAVNEVLPNAKVSVEHSLGKGLYGNIELPPEPDGSPGKLTDEHIAKVKDRMQAIIDADEPIGYASYPREEAVRSFVQREMWRHIRLIKASSKDIVEMYLLRGQFDQFDGPLVPNSSYLTLFDMTLYRQGFLLRFARSSVSGGLPPIVETPKLFDVFRENEKWLKILDVRFVSSLNDFVASGDFSDFVKICEALHAKKLSEITRRIVAPENRGRVILVSGPSSSGKTTFSKRLNIDLRVEGKRPVTISLDDYFCDRKETPVDDQGNKDYETIRAIDINLFNIHLLTLLDGKEIELPKYDFTTGVRRRSGRRLQIPKNDFIIVEGIHALNDELTPSIPPELKFKIYVSALTQLNIDEHNRIRTTDTRLIRRIVRDQRFRSYSCKDTLLRWPLVRTGEEKWIFPFQEHADVMFNSALVYEHTVMKPLVEPLLREIHEDDEVFAEAQRMLHFLSFFMSAKDDGIPPTSILREFIGGSSFSY